MRILILALAALVLLAAGCQRYTPVPVLPTPVPGIKDDGQPYIQGRVLAVIGLRSNVVVTLEVDGQRESSCMDVYGTNYIPLSPGDLVVVRRVNDNELRRHQTVTVVALARIER